MARHDGGCGIDEHEEAAEMLVQICRPTQHTLVRRHSLGELRCPETMLPFGAIEIGEQGHVRLERRNLELARQTLDRTCEHLVSRTRRLQPQVVGWRGTVRHGWWTTTKK